MGWFRGEEVRKQLITIYLFHLLRLIKGKSKTLHSIFSFFLPPPRVVLIFSFSRHVPDWKKQFPSTDCEKLEVIVPVVLNVFICKMRV